MAPVPLHGPRPSGPLLKDAVGWHSRGYLTHFNSSAVIQSVTYRLADGLPSKALTAMESRLNAFENDERKARLRSAIERYLDSGRGTCVLRKPMAAQSVIDAWRHFDGQRYRLHAWVVMPNHVHVLVEPMHGHRLPDIVRSWKSFTARVINRSIGRSGALWMPDYWDRFVRDEDHYRRVLDYIRQNPVKAGLVDRAEQWRWSSAFGG